MSSKFPIRGWQWIFYVYGWFTGLTNLLFWAVMIAFHFVNQEKHFFSAAFHRRVFIWGIVMFILSVITVVTLLSIAILIPLVVGQL